MNLCILAEYMYVHVCLGARRLDWTPSTTCLRMHMLLVLQIQIIQDALHGHHYAAHEPNSVDNPQGHFSATKHHA